MDLLSFVRAIHFAGALLLAGALIFEVLIVAPTGLKVASRLRRQWSWLAWAALVIATLSGAAWLVLIARAIDGTFADAFQSGSLTTLLMQTRFGQVLLLRGLLAAIVAGCLVSRERSPLRARIALCASVISAATIALSGHSGAEPGAAGAVYLSADALHIVAAAVWLGGLPPLAMLLRSAQRSRIAARDAAKSVTLRFSVAATCAVVTLLASGLINTWHLVGVDALFTTGYGALLLAKAALVAPMLGIAAVNRFLFTPAMTEPGALFALWRNTIVETALGALVLILVGVLGTTPPGRHAGHDHTTIEQDDDSAFVHIHGAKAMLDLSIEPGRAGVVRITMRLMREDLTTLPAERISLTLVHPNLEQPIVLPARTAGEGEWTAGPTTLPHSGIWTVQADITLNSASHTILDAPITLAPNKKGDSARPTE